MTNVAPTDEHASLPCPLCQYDLRGATEPRCTECGYQTSWEELRDPKRRLHPFLFEHHPESNFKSFFRTLFATLRPGRFWRSVFDTQPSFPSRLRTCWLTYSLLSITLYIAITWPLAAVQSREGVNKSRAWNQGNIQNRPELEEYYTSQYGSLEAYLDYMYPLEYATHIRIVAPAVFCSPISMIALFTLLWVPGTVLLLCIFQGSRRRRQLKSHHIMRCAIYCGDISLWFLPLVTTYYLSVYDFSNYVWTSSDDLWAAPMKNIEIVWIPLALFSLLALARFYYAMKHYLRFDCPLPTALATQVVWLLLWCNLILAPSIWLSRG